MEGDAWILEDDECGQFAVASRSNLERLVAIHFALFHGRTGTIVEGVDFRRLPPSLRCELCGVVAEPPWWEHMADPPLASVGDEDGHWLLCDPCHEFVVLRDVEGLVERMRVNMTACSPGVLRSPWGTPILDAMLQQTRVLLSRLDDGRREEL